MLELESYDSNSEVGSTLKVDTIKLLVADTSSIVPI